MSTSPCEFENVCSKLNNLCIAGYFAPPVSPSAQTQDVFELQRPNTQTVYPDCMYPDTWTPQKVYFRPDAYDSSFENAWGQMIRGECANRVPDVIGGNM